MNIVPENIIVNSCEYTPVYLIPSTSVTQAGSYIITQSNQDAHKPVADNLKTFYENSGNLESSLLSSPKPRILKKVSTNVVGNNLKLASFLLPKSEVTNIQSKPCVAPVNTVSPIIVKPVVTPITPIAPITPVSTVSSVELALPSIEIDRKIVRVGNITNTKTTRTHYPRVLPKKKPNEIIDPNPSKHTSVQLLKLGETYHSLNQLSAEQMKIVNKALKIFSDPEKTPKEPAYDPITNTKFIYKVVSPRDLTVVGKNKVVVPKKKDIRKQKVVLTVEPDSCPVEPIDVQPKVTRSGRTVKLPKPMRPNESPQRRKKKVGSVVNCFQCSAEFCSFYRLQRHYETYPTHIPARIHTNLFHCLLAIIKGGSDEDQANIFIQQLEHLIEKLKSLLPCLLKKVDGEEGQLCTINDDIGRLFGMNSGKYHLNMEALNCVKNKEGHCLHSPAPKNNQFNNDVSKPSQLWLSKHNEEIANKEAETEDCARINSVDKWPTASKRIWKLKQQKLNAKKIRLTSENDQPIEMDLDDDVTCSSHKETSAISLANSEAAATDTNTFKSIDVTPVVADRPMEEESSVTIIDQNIKPKNHAQFHSAHFDIRSSPIKLPSSLVKKFQINPDKITQCEVQILRPLSLENDIAGSETNKSLHELFRSDVELPKEDSNNELSFSNSKVWELNTSNGPSPDSFMKSNILFETPVKNENVIEPALIHLGNGRRLFEPQGKSIDITDVKSLQIKNSKNSLIDQTLIQVNDKSNDLFRTDTFRSTEENDFCYEQSLMHIKPKCNSLIGSSLMHMKNKTFESALSHVKERSNNLFDTTLLQPRNKTNKPQGQNESNLYHTTLVDIKERSNLFESNLMDIKDKDTMIDPTLLLKDDDTGLFHSVSQRKKCGLLEAALAHDDKSNYLIEQTLMITKNVVQTPMNIEEQQSDCLSTNESRLITNEGQSVLTFLESLGNEPLDLAYPETEIRNSSVDFQLDLFSFNNS